MSVGELSVTLNVWPGLQIGYYLFCEAISAHEVMGVFSGS